MGKCSSKVALSRIKAERETPKMHLICCWAWAVVKKRVPDLKAPMHVPMTVPDAVLPLPVHEQLVRREHAGLPNVSAATT